MTPGEIAKATDAGVSTILDLESVAGRQPRYRLGVALIELHAKRVTQHARRKGVGTARKKAA